jgi:hypothetical protein
MVRKPPSGRTEQTTGVADGSGGAAVVAGKRVVVGVAGRRVAVAVGPGVGGVGVGETVAGVGSVGVIEKSVGVGVTLIACGTQAITVTTNPGMSSSRTMLPLSCYLFRRDTKTWWDLAWLSLDQ